MILFLQQTYCMIIIAGFSTAVPHEIQRAYAERAMRG
jgi:hypothetical protein